MSDAQRSFRGHATMSAPRKLHAEPVAPLRSINPRFLVLHYHLAMWQSAPRCHVHSPTATGGTTTISARNAHESWFWHNSEQQRVASRTTASC
jgi:hypothetical protein